MWQVISLCLDSYSITDCWAVLEQMLDILNTADTFVINYPRNRYVERCIRANDLTPALIDSIMMQRQYIDSFTNISPGLYITTVHQSKGKEFDCVFVVDIDDIETDANLLYVSHSRMKERLYPIKMVYTGANYGQ
jgi:superfamily I DNA/RNA helicase